MSKIVLCVDDSATMQQVADITFRGTEFQYVGARTFDEGLEKAKGQQPAIVLADAVLVPTGGSGKSGYDLCMALKSDGATQHIPVVILVGNSAPYDAAKGVAVGADANLPKPWDTQTMLEKVIEVVANAATGVAKVGAGVGGAAAAPTAVAPSSSAPTVKLPVATPAAQPPRSATIMGMPTVKLPGGVATPVSVNTPPSAPVSSRTTVMAVPPISGLGNAAPVSGGPGATPGLRPPAAAPAAAAPVAPATPEKPAPAAAPAPVAASSAPASSTASAASALASSGTNRAPMISGTPTKRSKLVEATYAKMAARLAEASGLEAGSPELLALLKLSTEVVERIVWEIVPELAEQIIRENMASLTASKRPS